MKICEIGTAPERHVKLAYVKRLVKHCESWERSIRFVKVVFVYRLKASMEYFTDEHIITAVRASPTALAIIVG